MNSRSKRVPKPYPTFPLFADANGSWRKKINGRKLSFGPVRWPNEEAYVASWRNALDAYHAYMEQRATDTARAADPSSTTIGYLTDVFLTAKHNEAESGTLKPRTFAALRQTLSAYRACLGMQTTVRELEDDPSRIYEHLQSLDSRLGFHAYNRSVQYIRSMWNMVTDPTLGVLAHPFKWLRLHKQKPMKEFRRQRRLERAAGVFMTFEPDEVAALIANSTNGWRRNPLLPAFVLLGYFAGYGNTDIAEFPVTAMRVFTHDENIFVRGRGEKIPAGWAILDFPRPKTEIDRCALVPPLVVDAIRRVIALRRPPIQTTKHLVFRTSGGRPVVYDNVHRDESALIDRTTPTDNVAQAFGRLVKCIGWCPAHGWRRRKTFLRNGGNLCSDCGAPLEMMKPRGFYCLRHTATTFAAGSGANSDARNLFEGHGGGGVRQAFYLDPTKLHDLLLIARDLERQLEDGKRRHSLRTNQATALRNQNFALTEAG